MKNNLILLPILDEMEPSNKLKSYTLITFVQDSRSDLRYAIDAAKIEKRPWLETCQTFATESEKPLVSGK